MRATRRAALAAALFACSARAVFAEGEPAPAAEFDSVQAGPVVDFGYGSSKAGDTLLGDLGGESAGIRTLGGRAWLLQWDALLAGRAGLLGNTHPFTPLVGVRTFAVGELGRRFSPAARASLYAGGRLGGELVVASRPGTALGDLDRLNDLDGVGGVSASGAARVAAGLSLLDGARSLLLVAFFQEQLRAPGIYTPGAAFSEGGVAARLDVARRLVASLEVLAGQTPASAQPALGTSDQTTIVAASALVRFVFSTGVWVQASGGWSREFDRRAYPSSNTAYATASAPTFGAALALGISLDGGRGGRRCCGDRRWCGDGGCCPGGAK